MPLARTAPLSTATERPGPAGSSRRRRRNWPAGLFTATPPEMAEEIRRTFDEAAFLADMEEAVGTGGADIDALIGRIERKAHAAD